MIKLRSLELAGFGIFKDPQIFTFSPFHIEIRANEEGKSTLIGGLLATIFGLTKEEKRNWYNWGNPHHFYGVLVWEKDGKIYHLKRDFERDQVELMREEKDSKAMLFQGIHKPSGRTPTHRHYEGLIEEITGIHTKEMAKTLFCAAQEEIAIDLTSRTLQEFVSGEGTRGYQDVLGTFAHELQTITKETKGIGTSSHKIKDRLLEDHKRNLDKMRLEWEESNRLLPETHEKRRELQQIEHDIAQLKRERDGKEQFLKLWNDWERLRGERGDAQEKQGTLGQAIRSYEQIQQRYQDLRDAFLHTGLARFEGAPNDLRDRLEELRDLERQKSGIQDIDKQIDEIKRSLEMKYKDILHLPLDYISQLKDLEIMRHGRKRLEEKIEDTERQVARQISVRQTRRSIFVGLTTGVTVLVLSLLFYPPLKSVSFGLIASVLIGLLAYKLLPRLSPDVSLSEKLPSIKGELEDIQQKLMVAEMNLGKDVALEQSRWVDTERHLKHRDGLISNLNQLTQMKEHQEKIMLRIMESRRALSGYLSGESQSAEATLKDLREYDERLKDLSNLSARMTGILQGHGAKSLEDLHQRQIDAQNRVLRLTKEIENLEVNYPALKDLSQSDISERHQEFEAIKQGINYLNKQLEEKETCKDRLRHDIAQLSGRGLINIENREEEIKELERRIQEKELERDALILVYETLKEAITEYQVTYKDRLAQRIGQYFKTFTLNRYGNISLDDAFGITICHREGYKLTPDQLSQGARDQLYLACRLAVNEILTREGGPKLPLIFDDSFVHFDMERLKRVKEALDIISQQHQIILLTHDVLKFQHWEKT